MLRVNAIGVSAVEYLLRGSGCDHTREHAHEPPERGHDAAGYFADAIERGEPSGVWHGRGITALGLDAREGQTALDDDVRAIFGQLRHPDSTEAAPRWIGSKPRSYRGGPERLEELRAKEPDRTEERDRQLQREAAGSGRRPVAYYDVTLSPAKSVSVYYAVLLAAGDLETAAAVRAAHDEAVRVALDYGEGHVAWTRQGRHGIDRDGQRVGEFVQATGWAVVTFSHSTSREAEPQLHTHAAILNRVATPDGRIGALDGKAFGPVKEAMGAAYSRALEQLLHDATGVVFETRPDGMAREIVGMDPELAAQGSTRRAQVVERVEDLVAAYRENYGQEPAAAARKAMAQAATLDTRRPKSGLAGPAAVAAWATDRREWCDRVLDDIEAAAIVATAGMSTRGRAAGPVAAGREPATPERRAQWLRAAQAAGIGDVQARFTTWTIGNLAEAIDRHLGDAAGALQVPVRDRARFVEQLARAAVAPDAGLDVVQLTGHEPVAVPDVLRRTDLGEDDRPRFRPANDERYATGAQLAAEDHIVGLARAVRGPVIRDLELGDRLKAAGLSIDQRSAVVGILSSDRGGAVLIGPAGAGKSRTVGAMAHEWAASTRGRVFGVAPSEIATQNLRQDGLVALNGAAFLGVFGGERPRDALRANDLVVVDEAGMSATSQLETIARLAAEAGARVVYAGDPEQLDAVEAGGMFAHLADTVDPGQRHDLTEVHRFTSKWEADASLLLRDGDHAAIDEYADRGRLHTGTVDEMGAAAARAFLADTLDGRPSLLIVGTNAHAAGLAGHVRDQLVELGRVDGDRTLAWVTAGEARGGQAVSAGDRIQTRLNAYGLRVEPAIDEHGRRGEARPVTNRATYTVLGLDEHGDVLARDEHGAIAHLPPVYLREHAALAYATTVHGAQGVTVDTAHVVLDRDASREQAYVGATRGRDANHLWLVTEREPDEHDPERVSEQAAQRLADVLDRAGAQTAATATRQAADAHLVGLTAVAARFDVVTGWVATERHDAALGRVLGDDDDARLQSDPGRGRLLRALREAEFSGHDINPVLEAATETSLAGSDSVADVLRGRVRRVTADRAPDREVDPTDWATRTVLGAGERDRYVEEIAEAANQRQAALGRHAAREAAEWAVAALGDAPEHPDGEGPATQVRAAWEDRAGIAAAYRELARIPDEQASLGAAPSWERELDRALWRDAVDALGQRGDDGAVDWRAAPDAELYAARERWEREQDAAPRWVADELAERHDLARQYREDAALERARLEAMAPEDPQASELAERLERSEFFAGHHRDAAADLEAEHEARQSWWAASAKERDAEAAAADELALRNLPPSREVDLDEPEQTVEPEPEPQSEPVPDVPDRAAEQREQLAESLRLAQERVQAAKERVAAMQRLDVEMQEDEFVRERQNAAEHQQELQREMDGPELDFDGR